MNPLENNKIELYNNGWTLVKNVFSMTEVEEIRKKAKSKKSIETLDSDILSNPKLGKIVYDERPINILEYLLNGGICYFGEGRLLIESINGRKGGAFHRDNPDRNEPNGPDWKSKYDVVRVGIYLEDHKNHSEGLGISSGSNRNQNVKPNRVCIVDNAPIEPGDILIWTLTTIHVGYPKKLKIMKSNKAISRGSIQVYGSKYYFNNLIYRFLPSALTLAKGRERIVLHIAYGKTASKHTERYIEYCKGRSYAVNRWSKTSYSKKLKMKINNSRITFIDMTQYSSNEFLEKAGGHFQLPI